VLPSDVQGTPVPDLQSMDAPIQTPEEDFPEPVAADAVTPDSVVLPDDQETSVLDPQDVDAYEQTSGASPFVSTADGVPDFEGLPKESDPKVPILGLGDGSICSDLMGEMQINNANETHVADPSADDLDLEVVASLDQPREGPQSVHAIGVAQSPADLPSSGESFLDERLKSYKGNAMPNQIIARRDRQMSRNKSG
jgi:hypothetical protein